MTVPGPRENQLAIRTNYDQQLTEFEETLLSALTSMGLPADSILVSVAERKRVFGNLPDVVSSIPPDQLEKAAYISKFLAAAACGLFDAALNYLWDETIYALRRRVGQYDVSYFFDTVIGNAERSKKLNEAQDLEKIQDSELIYGAKELGLLSEVGFKHLDYIRYMRNWVSAAHPNQNSITGLQLIGWLETCIREVISLPLTEVAVDIKQHLLNLKSNRITQQEADEIAPFFLELTQEQAGNLASGYFGIYTRADTSAQTRDNIRVLLPQLWNRVNEEIRAVFGVKYGTFVVNNDLQAKQLAREFLDIVDASQYLPNDIRASELKTALENLLNAHRGWENFYNEPPCAKEVRRLVGEQGTIPAAINRAYVLTLVEVFITNGNGVARNAEPTYLSLIQDFTPTQAALAILSFMDENISNRLQHTLCQKKYRELVAGLKSKVTLAAVKELMEKIEAFPTTLDRMRFDSAMKRRAEQAWKTIK